MLGLDVVGAKPPTPPIPNHVSKAVSKLATAGRRASHTASKLGKAGAKAAQKLKLLSAAATRKSSALQKAAARAATKAAKAAKTGVKAATQAATKTGKVTKATAAQANQQHQATPPHSHKAAMRAGGVHVHGDSPGFGMTYGKEMDSAAVMFMQLASIADVLLNFSSAVDDASAAGDVIAQVQPLIPQVQAKGLADLASQGQQIVDAANTLINNVQVPPDQQVGDGS